MAWNGDEMEKRMELEGRVAMARYSGARKSEHCLGCGGHKFWGTTFCATCLPKFHQGGHYTREGRRLLNSVEDDIDPWTGE